MKRLVASSLIFGVLAVFGFAGCGEESKTEVKQSTPGGTTTTTESVKQTGQNPPPAGDTATPAPKTP